jgi:hypothetical protein
MVLGFRMKANTKGINRFCNIVGNDLYLRGQDSIRNLEIEVFNDCDQ